MVLIETAREWRAHEFAEQLPLMDLPALEELTASIAARGVAVPVLVYEGQILDGRNRLAAARAAGLSHVPAEVFQGERMAAWHRVVDGNVVRRHLGSGQAAMSAAMLRARAPVPMMQTEAARVCGVTERYVRMAEGLLAHPSPQAADLAARVHRGELGLRVALRIADNDNARDRAPVIDPMPANPALEVVPGIQVSTGDDITRAARAALAADADPTAWLRSDDMAPAERYALAQALEDFARRAVDILAEELGAPNAVAAVEAVAARGGTAAQQHLARAHALAARTGVAMTPPAAPVRRR